MPVRVMPGALVVHRILMHLLAAEPCSTARTFILISVSLWNDLGDGDGVGLKGFKCRYNAFFIGLSC